MARYDVDRLSAAKEIAWAAEMSCLVEGQLISMQMWPHVQTPVTNHKGTHVVHAVLPADSTAGKTFVKSKEAMWTTVHKGVLLAVL